MLLGIEIGGTKLQLGVGAGDGELREFQRLEVRPALGAAGIRDQIAAAATEWIRSHRIQRVGIGFGGPVNAIAGTTIKSHQIHGWEDFPLVTWCQRELGVPAVIGNDCDLATLAESRWGAGRGRSSIFYVTAGTGVGGGCVLDGKLLGQGRPAIAEIGHLRPGLDAIDPHATVESLASGWGIASAVRQSLELQRKTRAGQAAADVTDLLSRCDHDESRLTSLVIADAARAGNHIARSAIDQACRALGWGIAQAITLLAPQRIVVGGGVALMGDELFLNPVRRYVDAYVFPPLTSSYDIVPAVLGEQVVVHGAIALAAGE